MRQTMMLFVWVGVFVAALSTRTALCQDVHDNDTVTIHLLDNQIPERVPINTSQTIQFELQKLTNVATSYVILQVHTQWQQVLVSLDANFSQGRTVSGSNVGALMLLEMDQEMAAWFVKLKSDVPAGVSVTLLVVARTYSKSDPVPGGCNMEFPLEIDPNIRLASTQHLSAAGFQYAHMGVRRGGAMDQCEIKSIAQHLEYDVYQIFLNERDDSESHFLEEMQDLLNQEPAHFDKKNKVTTIQYGKGKTLVNFASYPGQGVIYAVIVRQTINITKTYSAYIPAVTYSCSWTNGKCIFEDNVTLRFMAVLHGLLGLFWCFFGHRCFKFSMFMVGHLTFLVVFLLIFASSTNWGTTALILSSVFLGLVGGVLWLCVWIFLGIPVISVLLAGVLLGFLFASLLFNYTPFGLLYVWQNSFNFGMTFACAILIPAVFLLIFTKTLSIVSSAVIGSYLALFAVDVFLRGSIRLITINTILKAAVPGLLTAEGPLPLQITDMVLCVLWVIHSVSGFIVQWCHSRGRPDFPPCPWKVYKERQSMANLNNIAVNASDDDDDDDLLIPDTPDVRRPRLETAVPPIVDPL